MGKPDNDSQKGAGNVCKGIEELAAKREARGKARGKAEPVGITVFASII